MSYCVECGVELSNGAKSCPLCGTPVLNPRRPQEPDAAPLYPENREKPAPQIDRGYMRKLALAVALLPVLTVLILDLLDGRVSWSLYVIGAIWLIVCLFAVPFLFTSKRPYAFIALDAGALGAYLGLIALLNGGGGWYLKLALPMVLWLGLCLMGALRAVRWLKHRILNRIALVLTQVAVCLLGIETIIDYYLRQRVQITWSVYAGLPMLVLALFFLLLGAYRPLQKEIRKRLFF